jgi:tRNA pseudouridine55 synthase
LVAWEPPNLRFRAVVSAGTYLRAIARDLGDRLGVGAHLSALRREWIGPFRVEDALPLEALVPETPLLPPLALVRHLPQVPLEQGEATAVRQGRLVSRMGAAGEAVLVLNGELVAIAEGGPLGWQPRVVVPAS